MDAPDYTPDPIDSSAVSLIPGLDALTEKLAENAHDLWARERIAQGWTWGPQRDDAAKKHPCLISYADLPDAEKKFDRDTAMGTLRAMLAMGYTVQPPQPRAAPPLIITRESSTTAPLQSWIAGLQDVYKQVTVPKNDSPRRWTFDMDDAPEIAALPAGHFMIARDALTFLQETVYPGWVEADAKAMERQVWHKRVATTAIGAGITAIISAILQLVMERLSTEMKHTLGHIELAAILVAAIAVFFGVFLHLHHGWLASRQRAERLRVLKFRALAWRELWCDFDAWKERVRACVKSLSSLDSIAARKWAEETAAPDAPDHLAGCVVPAGDLAVLSALHQIKRLQFQQHYFQFQSRKANPRSRIADWKVGMWLFFATVVVVLIHRFHWHPEGAHFDACLIGLAALLPVVGFGLRAWLAAFETPRSRNLFRAKARALEYFISRGSAHAASPEHFRSLVADGEDVFTNEHREWCRLQLEAEWFV